MRQLRVARPIQVQPTAQLKRFRRKAQGPSAYVKISEGCDHKCAFCIIPKMRGHYRSRSIESIVQEAEQLAARLGVIQDEVEGAAQIERMRRQRGGQVTAVTMR